MNEPVAPFSLWREASSGATSMAVVVWQPFRTDLIVLVYMGAIWNWEGIFFYYSISFRIIIYLFRLIIILLYIIIGWLYYYTDLIVLVYMGAICGWEGIFEIDFRLIKYIAIKIYSY